MLPNWLLGKSKSKLQEILGGGGGGTSYTAGDGIDISNGVISFDPATTPAIDPSKIDGLDDDLAALAPKSALSNPNILHNPWFTVNQRGKTTYASAGYTVDRWKLTSSDMTVNVGDNGIELIHADNNNDASLANILTQNVANALLGKTLTLSVLDTNGNIYANTFTLPEEFPSQQTFYGFLRIPDTGTDYFYIDFMSNILGATKFAIRIGSHVANATISIRAIKLEVGGISTLHLDPRPEYATELAKCQRYFQRISGDANSIIDWGFSTNGNIVRFCIHIKEMRTKPTMTYRNVICGDAAPSSFTLAGYTSGRVQVNASVSSASTINLNYRLLLDSNGYIDFSADL